MRSSKAYNEHIYLSNLEDKIYSKWCVDHGIAYSLLKILDLLYGYQEGVEVSFISDKLVFYKQTVTGLLKQLKESGYITWSKDKDDKRKKVVTLTQSGVEYAELVLTQLYEKEDKVFNSLTEEEKHVFNSIYKKIVTELEKELGQQKGQIENG